MNAMTKTPKKTSSPSKQDPNNGATGQPADDGKGAAEVPKPGLGIIVQYIKDLSFETPNAPNFFVLMQKKAPDITMNVDVSEEKVEDYLHEVSITIKAECKSDDTVGFVFEICYTGLFSINVPEEHLQNVLYIECPRILFPFARAIVSNITREGGFPPLNLGMIDFAALLQAQLNKSGTA
jgi:preprotein translocase subunit SecB